jgi:hypothetical protein
VLLFEGDSFTYGVGLSDGQTLASVLTKDKSIPAYNGGRFHDDPEGLPESNWLPSHCRDRRKLEGPLERRESQLEGDRYYARMVNTFSGNSRRLK